VRNVRTKHFVLAVIVLGASCAGARAQDRPMSPLELAAACASPPSLDAPPADALRVVATQDTVPRGLAGNRDLLVINGGTRAGVQLGQAFYVRRPNRFGTASTVLSLGSRTLGWIRVVAANESTAIAAVEHACGGIIEDDFLAPFAPPVVPAGADRDDPTGEPDFTSLARVIVGSEDRQAAAAGDFVLIDRGSNQGLAAGTRLALYRDVRVAGMPLASVGEAVVITVGPLISLTRITRARDAVLSGDYVAVRR
jgi:hypothetical protein